MRFDSEKIMIGSNKLLGFLNSPDYYNGSPLNDAEKLVILKTSASSIENSLAVEAMLIVYKTAFDTLDSTKK